tara:strand:- start:164 stop:481 length:318 start_codon:yes stop_codon:yes gene_type:complete
MIFSGLVALSFLIFTPFAKADSNKVTLICASYDAYCHKFKRTWRTLKEKCDADYKFIEYDLERDQKKIRKYNPAYVPVLFIEKNKKIIEIPYSFDSESICARLKR